LHRADLHLPLIVDPAPAQRRGARPLARSLRQTNIQRRRALSPGFPSPSNVASKRLIPCVFSPAPAGNSNGTLALDARLNYRASARTLPSADLPEWTATRSIPMPGDTAPMAQPSGLFFLAPTAPGGPRSPAWDAAAALSAPVGLGSSACCVRLSILSTPSRAACRPAESPAGTRGPW